MPIDESARAPLTKTQKRTLLAAWLGWCFDGLDGYLFIAVSLPLVKSLLTANGASADTLESDAKIKAAYIQAAFFVGWTFGGAFFGRLGDRIGRTKTLSLTILTYAVFTGLGFFATQWWHLLMFRFLAALGIGGEWAAGSALVSETLHHRHKAWASALLQSGYILGIIAATLTGGWLKETPRAVFLIGVIPAFVVLWIRSAVPEPETFHHARANQVVPRWQDLFAPGIARVTLTITAFVTLALVTVWVFIFYTPQAVWSLPLLKSATREAQLSASTGVALVYFTFNIVGNFAATYCARHLGTRTTFALFAGVAMLSLLIGYRSPASIGDFYLWASVFAFSGLGLFAIFPLYIPPQFPVLLRTLGSGFAYNVGRLVTAAGTIFAGEIARSVGGPAHAVWWIALLYIPAIGLCIVLPRDRHAIESTP